MSKSHSDSSNSVTAPERWAPALLTITSMPPISSAALSINARMSSASDTSVCTNRALPPSSSMSATVLWASSSFMSATTTEAPSLAKSRAVALPMPVAAPVMIATLP
jgi:hypothetical protein